METRVIYGGTTVTPTPSPLDFFEVGYHTLHFYLISPNLLNIFSSKYDRNRLHQTPVFDGKNALI